ncbi:MAG: LysR family transcriptional regulator [Thermoleophilia bacterium]|nr:LysR family transcriptional regulator [Thermoleophilia bacterium]
MLDPRRALTFREVARQRSFSRAAVSLSLTQPAVSQQIRALELQLGEQLIERRRGQFELTAVGELLLEHAEALHERLQLAKLQLGESAGAARRQLRLAAFPSALATLVPSAIARLHAETEIEVSAVQGSTEDAVAAVRDGRAHIALCFQDASLPRREHAGTRRSDVLEEAMLATVGRGHRLAGRKRIRLAELADDPWLAATRDGLIVRACRTAGFEPRLAYLTEDPLAINSFVAAGLAVTLTSELLAPHFRHVSVLALAGGAPRRTIYAVAPPGRMHPLAGAFLNALR